jgi:hypothetical protein
MPLSLSPITPIANNDIYIYGEMGQGMNNGVANK